MPVKSRDKRRRIAYVIKQLLIFLFLILNFLLFLFIIGNFQEFHDSTQINIISWLRLISEIYLWLAVIHLGLFIIEWIIFKAVNPGFLIFLVLSSAYILLLRIIFTAAEKIII